jgi:methionyl aminopeptidase
MIECKSPQELQVMDRANRLVHLVLRRLEEEVRPGLATSKLDRLAESVCRDEGGVPAFKGYRGFPASVCVSLNDEVVHGIPSATRVLRDGDIVSLDFGVLLDGFYGDSAISLPVGTVGEEAERLLAVTRGSLDRAVEAVRLDGRVSDISRAVQDHVEAAGFSVVREFVGHGIGRKLHEDPPVPNFVGPGRNPRLREGMVLAIEPMVTAGEWKVRTEKDRWTVRTADGSLAAHFEYSVAVTQEGPWVLGVEREAHRERAAGAG